MSAGETLQAATEDLRFSWLRTVSGLIASCSPTATSRRRSRACEPGRRMTGPAGRRTDPNRPQE
jgi:hypothetical protein